MTTERVSLREQEELRDVALPASVADALRGSPLDLHVTERRSGVYDLRARNTVGTVVARGVTVTVTPKLPVERLAWMLDVVGRVPPPGSEIDSAPAEDLLAFLQVQYAHALDEALRHGPVRDYRVTEEDRSAVRGRIDWTAVHTRRFGRIPPVPCRFDDYVVDSEPNRILLAAARALIRWRPSDAARALQRLTAQLEGVAEVRYPPTAVPELHLDRRHRHLERALRLAQLVLRRSGVEQVGGHVRAIGMVVDMARLYEDFVIVALREALGADHRTLVAKPPPLYLDPNRRLVELRLDGLLLTPSGERLAVIDAKYKSAPFADRGDVYQMVTYLVGTHVRRGVLVYADAREAEIEAGVDNKVLSVRIGLVGSTADILAEVRTAAERIAAFSGWRPPS